MSIHHRKAVIKFAGQAKERINRPGEPGQLSRRGFIRKAAMVGAGAAFAFGNAPGILAGGKEAGQITLDALLFTYFSPPLGTVSSSSIFLGIDYAVTFRLGLLDNPAIVLKARVPEDKENPCTIGRQNTSALVKKGITLRQTFKCGALSGTSAGPGTPENVHFFGLIRPTLKLKGKPGKLKFWFLRAEGTFSLLASTLQSEEAFVPPSSAVKRAIRFSASM